MMFNIMKLKEIPVKDFFDWMDDKNLIVIVIGILGILALILDVDQSVALIEKMTYGLLGMAVGKQMGIIKT